jgi:hypothetical protein
VSAFGSWNEPRSPNCVTRSANTLGRLNPKSSQQLNDDHETLTFLSLIEGAGVPALRIAFTIAVLVLAGAGLLIYHKRHQLFDRDPEVEDDIPVVRHNRFEEVLLVWGADAGCAQSPLSGVARVN